MCLLYNFGLLILRKAIASGNIIQMARFNSHDRVSMSPSCFIYELKIHPKVFHCQVSTTNVTTCLPTWS